jgi:hypothetical protein
MIPMDKTNLHILKLFEVVDEDRRSIGVLDKDGVHWFTKKEYEEYEASQPKEPPIGRVVSVWRNCVTIERYKTKKQPIIPGWNK